MEQLVAAALEQAADDYGARVIEADAERWEQPRKNCGR